MLLQQILSNANFVREIIDFSFGNIEYITVDEKIFILRSPFKIIILKFYQIVSIMGSNLAIFFALNAIAIESRKYLCWGSELIGCLFLLSV